MNGTQASDGSGGFRGAAVSGAFSTGLGTAVKGLSQVFAIVVLARLLTPADFGVVAMVFPILAFASIFQEAGLGVAVMQRTQITAEELSTVFWLNVAIGLVLALILVAVSPLAASFYNEPRVQGLTAACGGLILLAALSTQHLSLLNRNLQFRELALIDGLSLIFGTALAIGVAALTGSYWAIFLLNLGTVLTACVLAWIFSSWRPGARTHVRNVLDLLRFGGNMTGANIATYFGRNLDNVLIGRVWGPTALGFYERAYKVVLIPILFVHMPLFRLLVPMLSQIRDEPERYRRMFLLGYQGALLLTVPGIVLLIALTDVVVALVMGAQWVAGSAIFGWLAVACLIQCATGPLSILFVSQERSDENMKLSIAVSLYSCAAFAIGVNWGALGVAIAYAISSAVRTPLELWYVARKGPVRVRDIAQAGTPFLLAAVLCYVIFLPLSRYVEGLQQPLLFTLAGGALVYLVTLPCLLINRVSRNFLHEMFTVAQGLASKRMR